MHSRAQNIGRNYLAIGGFLRLPSTIRPQGRYAKQRVRKRCELFWEDENSHAKQRAEAVIQLEKLGNEHTMNHAVDILCGDSLGSVEKMDPHLFQRICAEHSAVYSQ